MYFIAIFKFFESASHKGQYSFLFSNYRKTSTYDPTIHPSTYLPAFKFRFFWKGHKIWKKSRTYFDKLTCQNKWDFFFNFMAFSQCLNFTSKEFALNHMQTFAKKALLFSCKVHSTYIFKSGFENVKAPKDIAIKPFSAKVFHKSNVGRYLLTRMYQAMTLSS